MGINSESDFFVVINVPAEFENDKNIDIKSAMDLLTKNNINYRFLYSNGTGIFFTEFLF